MFHAVNGTRGHDQAWKRACQDVMDFYPELHLDIYATREEAKAFRKALPPTCGIQGDLSRMWSRIHGIQENTLC